MASNIYFISDTHFFHRRILEYCGRVPGSRGTVWDTVEAMNEGLRERWNKKVPKTATVYMLGDVAFGKDKSAVINFLYTLNGTKHLIYGNHDKLIRSNEKDFLRVFETIQEYKEVNVCKQKICLFHYAPRVWNGAHRGYWCLWGHSHGVLEPHGKSVDVGIDSPWVTGKQELAPFSFEEIQTFMYGREKIEHHGDKEECSVCRRCHGPEIRHACE